MAIFDKSTNTVIFKSAPSKYIKERDSKKCNTVRKLSTLESEVIWAVDLNLIIKIKIINKGEDKNDLCKSPYSFLKDDRDRFFLFEKERS